AYDRQHALQLVKAGVDVQVRETFGSAVAFGEAALRALGVPADEAAAISTQIRKLDAERFEMEVASNDSRAGARLVIGNRRQGGAPAPKPTPFVPPKRPSVALNAGAEQAATPQAPTQDPADTPPASALRPRPPSRPAPASPRPRRGGAARARAARARGP